jgi:hypothetical protein
MTPPAHGRRGPAIAAGPAQRGLTGVPLAHLQQTRGKFGARQRIAGIEAERVPVRQDRDGSAIRPARFQDLRGELLASAGRWARNAAAARSSI